MSMNIKQAKQEITNTLRAYLTRDELGNYLIPENRQRPVLLMGPPGIGKTQIMTQIASETGVGLVAYTITHHTRQSAIGLPFIEHRTYDGEEVTITEYTMSEILASVYDMMERTGIREGILFLDEINCVSETLAPVMLQFLQNKTFGNRKMPPGWLIVAAGNPPEYNRSARDFDVVTLDRVKRIDVTWDFRVWKEYARRNNLHGAVISYLDIKKDNFYRIENTVDGMRFATARGWEDLSELIYAYEKLGLSVDREVVEQYIQMPEIAKDFANYLSLYNKYQKTYNVASILAGKWLPVTMTELRTAPFDEKLAVIGLLFSRLAEDARRTRRQDALTDAVFADLKKFRASLGLDHPEQSPGSVGAAECLPAAHGQGFPDTPASPAAIMTALADRREQSLKRAQDAGQNDKEKRDLAMQEISLLTSYAALLKEAESGNSVLSPEEAMDLIREQFTKLTEERQTIADETGTRFDNVFRFLEASFGQGQELVIFVTEITAGYDTSWFVENFGCDAYYRHNRELLFDDTQSRIAREIESMNSEAAPTSDPGAAHTVNP